jgi:fatty-acyl-CoA synthase
MKSTMKTAPLLISSLMRFGTTMHGDSEVVTWTANGPRRTTYRELGRQAAQLAHALRGLGVTDDQRVGTFMWNNAEHLMAYLAVPSMGAVLHALNIRLFPEQLVYVANHGRSEVVIVDNTLAAPFAQLLPHLPAVRHVIVNGPVDESVTAALAGHVEAVHDLAGLIEGQPTDFDWPEPSTRTMPPRCATPPARPAIPKVLPTPTGATTCTRWGSAPASESPRPTAYSSSCRSSTPTPGATPTARW